MVYRYQYARPALTADCVVFGLADEGLKVLLIQRSQDPFRGRWALPGGFAEVGESLEMTARRELEEETGLANICLEQLHTFSDPDRDPREHVVTVVYFTLTKLTKHSVRAASDASNAAWFKVDQVPPLAFDHDRILAMATERLRDKVVRQPIGVELLPEKFSLCMLRELYEKILGRPLDKKDFQRKVLGAGILEELNECETGSDDHATRLYRFDKKSYDEKLREGFVFDI